MVIVTLVMVVSSLLDEAISRSHALPLARR